MLPTDPDALDFLRRGHIEVQGRMVDASNATLFCAITTDGVQAECVYKPVRGERPLWDFPDGTLAGREVAAYLTMAGAGTTLIPPTVLREGPFGSGMVQLWVDVDPERALVDVLAPAALPPQWRGVLRAEDEYGNPAVLAHADTSEVRMLAALDVVINNADRKGGHVLAGADGGTYGVDHGVCLHTENKLRTVLWGFLGEPLSEEAMAGLKILSEGIEGSLGEELCDHLTLTEVRSIRDRLRALLRRGRYPSPKDSLRPIPWPAF
ncbi:MAG: SCO1664 family protein [Sciscionella sp.]